MDISKLTAISTGMVAFSGFLAVLIALVSYLYNKARISEIITWINIYILANILFLYFLKKQGEKK